MSLQRLQRDIPIIISEAISLKSESMIRGLKIEVSHSDTIAATENQPAQEIFDLNINGATRSYWAKVIAQEAVMKDQYCGILFSAGQLNISNNISVDWNLSETQLPALPPGKIELAEPATAYDSTPKVSSNTNGQHHLNGKIQLNGENGKKIPVRT